MAVRRLHMLTTGPDGNYSPGQILIIESGQAAVLVDCGHAIYTDESPIDPPTSQTRLKKGRR